MIGWRYFVTVRGCKVLPEYIKTLDALSEVIPLVVDEATYPKYHVLDTWLYEAHESGLLRTDEYIKLRTLFS